MRAERRHDVHLDLRRQHLVKQPCEFPCIGIQPCMIRRQHQHLARRFANDLQGLRQRLAFISRGDVVVHPAACKICRHDLYLRLSVSANHTRSRSATQESSPPRRVKVLICASPKPLCPHCGGEDTGEVATACSKDKVTLFFTTCPVGSGRARFLCGSASNQNTSLSFVFQFVLLTLFGADVDEGNDSLARIPGPGRGGFALVKLSLQEADILYVLLPGDYRFAGPGCFDERNHALQAATRCAALGSRTLTSAKERRSQFGWFANR